MDLARASIAAQSWWRLRRWLSWPWPAARATPPGRGRPPVGWRARLTRWLGQVGDTLSLLLAVALIALYAWVVWRSPLETVPEEDCHAYLLMAKKLSQGQWPAWEDDFWRFTDHQWVTAADGRVMAKYAPGMPLLMAVGYRLDGLRGALRVPAACGIVAALALWGLALYLLGPPGAALVVGYWVAATWTFPFSNYPLTHIPDQACLLVAALAAARLGRYRHWADAMVLGLAAGFLPVLRPTNLLLWPALLWLLWLASKQGPRPVAWPGWGPLWRRSRAGLVSLRATAGWRALGQIPVPAWLPTLLVAGLLPLLALAAYHHLAFGAPWRTGYSASGEQDAFSFARFPDQWQTLVNNRGVVVHDLLWALSFLGLLAHATRRGFLVLIGLWVLPLTALMLCYYWTANGTAYLRLYFPIIPGLALAAGLPLARWRAAPLRLLWPVLLALGLYWLPVTPWQQALGLARAAWAKTLPEPPPVTTSLYMATKACPECPSVLTLVRDEMARAGGGPVTLYGHTYPLWTASAALDGVTAIWATRFTAQALSTGPTDFNRPRQDLSRQERLRRYYDEGLAVQSRRFHAHVTRELKRGQSVLLILPRWVPARNFLDYPPAHLRYETVEHPTANELGRGTVVVRATWIRPPPARVPE